MEMLSKILSLIGLGGAKIPGAGQGGAEVTIKPPDPLLMAQANYQYNRDLYRSLLNYAIAEAGVILFLIAIAGWIILTANPQDRFFVATVDGRITRIIPLDTPTATNSDMYSRIGTAIANSLTFGYLDYDQLRLQGNSLFEQAAYDKMMNTFMPASAVAEMKQNGYIYVTKVEPSRPGGVVSQGVKGNVYQWVITVPLMVVRKQDTSEQGETATRWNITVLVSRAKALEVSRGFSVINVINAQPIGPSQAVPAGQGGAP